MPSARFACRLAVNCLRRGPAVERILVDRRDAVGNRDARKTCATPERSIADRCDAVGNRDACKPCAIRERIIADRRDAVVIRDYAVITTEYQGLRSRFNQAVSVGMINGVSFGNRNVCKTRATQERLTAD